MTIEQKAEAPHKASQMVAAVLCAMPDDKQSSTVALMTAEERKREFYNMALTRNLTPKELHEAMAHMDKKQRARAKVNPAASTPTPDPVT